MAKKKAKKKKNPKSYGQFCPVAKAAEIVAERWTPLVLRELICGSHRFSDMQKGVPLMSPSLLSRRLKELIDAGIVEKRKGRGPGYEYHLTEAGEELQPVIMTLGEWGYRWAQADVTKDELDPALLMWDVKRRVNAEGAPPDGTVVEFDIAGVPRAKRRWWLVFGAGGEVELCMKNPGYEVDMTVEAEIRTLVDVWMGNEALKSALRDETLLLRGPRHLVRGFGDWFELSVFAGLREG
jgi:DNA-binding HxlR family transcriptional regulator